MRRSMFAGLLLFGGLTGCADDQAASPEAGAARRAEGPTDPGAAQTSEGEIPIRVTDWAGVQKLVAENRGQVVVVDIWSTYCVPCVREFPNLVDLHEEYPDKVAAISVNTNFSGPAGEQPGEEVKKTVREFLADQGATFQNVIMSTPDLDFYERIDLSGPPAVYVYDQSGELVKRFDNEDASGPEEEFTYQKDVIPLVEKLLAEGRETSS